MRLIYEETGKEVKVGDELAVTRNGIDFEALRVSNIQKPHKPSSTGRVCLQRENGGHVEYFPSVIGAKWIEREDHGWTPESDRPRGDAGVVDPQPKGDGERLFELAAEYDALQAEIDELRQRVVKVNAERDQIMRKLFHEPVPVRQTS